MCSEVRDLLQEFQKRIPESVRRHIRRLALFGAAEHRMDSRFRGNDHPAVVPAEAGTQANARLAITRKLRLNGVGCGCLGAAGRKITEFGGCNGNHQN